MNLIVTAATHIGKRREKQEDAYAVQNNFWVVADGMGGHSKGEIAAQAAAEAALKYKDKSLDEICMLANEAVCNIPRRFSEASPGTTLLLARRKEDKLELASVGDSYIMKLNDNIIINERHEDERGYLTSHIGMFYNLKVWIGEVTLNVGDKYILVTDGLDALKVPLFGGSSYKPSDVLLCANAQEVIDKVLESSAYDNITCVYIEVKE